MTISSWANLVFSMCMTMIAMMSLKDEDWICVFCTVVAFTAIIIERIYGG